ncbi:MAG: hypothetical protein JWP06_413 [Candidatus Saccharibacteria bacterium]|nr:hypothetical protein [Candidatus Saccharibacteria bacterium]
MSEFILDRQTSKVWTPSGSPEMQQRAFRIETLHHDSRTLNLLSLEADYASDERVTPPDWQEQVSQAMESADLVFVEYFVPELEENMPYFHKMGSFSRNIADVFGRVADMAHKQGKNVAVADIANKPLYEAWHLGVFPAVGATALAGARSQTPLGIAAFAAGEAYVASLTYQAARKKGTYSVEPGRMERYTPNANDARRALTARGISQTAKEYPPDSSFLYISAPAHIARVKSMLEQPLTIADSAKVTLYKKFAGLDRTTRIYSPRENGWELQSATPIR